mgnify:CR=1 FL=1
MQRPTQGSTTPHQDCFSIHKRIEGGATGLATAIPAQPGVVSVSTSGSKGVQRPAPTQTAKPPDGFSIHKRIEGGATGNGGGGNQHHRWFQYPQADRRGCNDPPNCAPGGQVKTFQYPQADRRGCNLDGGVELHDGLQVSVSTSGSKGVQPLKELQQFVELLSFSIHKRIEGGATGYSAAQPHGCAYVSVSTSGSKGVQLQSAAAYDVYAA